MSRLGDAIAELSESIWALAAVCPALGSPARGDLREQLGALRRPTGLVPVAARRP